MGDSQARQVPVEEPDEACPSVKGREREFRSAIPTLLGLGANHPHTRKDSMDAEVKDSRMDQNVRRLCRNWKT